MIDILLKYFPNLSETQKTQFAQLGNLYESWNAKINVISRKDIGNFYERHVLHSLAIAKFIDFPKGTKIIDVGTGGGFPGIPLAVFFPECHFVLVDSIGKKIKVASEIAQSIGLKNVEILHRNVCEEKREFDFIVSRAVMQAGDLIHLVRKNIIRKSSYSTPIPRGLICLKGGELTEELQVACKLLENKKSSSSTSPCVECISQWFEEDFFETKKIMYIPL